MTVDEKRQLAATLERAEAKGIRVVGTGMRRDTGEMVFLVNSASHPGRLHIVHQVDEHTLACSCEAGQHDRYCVHRAVTHKALCEMRAHEIARRQVQAAATAILYRNDRPFNVFA